jgi:hypothetical protein
VQPVDLAMAWQSAERQRAETVRPDVGTLAPRARTHRPGRVGLVRALGPLGLNLRHDVIALGVGVLRGRFRLRLLARLLRRRLRLLLSLEPLLLLPLLSLQQLLLAVGDDDDDDDDDDDIR